MREAKLGMRKAQTQIGRKSNYLQASFSTFPTPTLGCGLKGVLWVH